MKTPATNKVLPKAGLNGFDWTFVQGSTFVLRLNFCAKTPAFGNTQTVGYMAGRRIYVRLFVRYWASVPADEKRRAKEYTIVSSSNKCNTGSFTLLI